jgi:hypothetical protein
MFGYVEGKLTGQPVESLVPSRRRIHNRRYG